MSTYRKNIMVGVTVLGGIIVLGWMFLQFSGQLVGALKPPQLAIQFESTRADGLSDGSAVFFLGVQAGRVSSVKRKADGSGVLIEALIDREPPLPENVRAQISSSNALGGTASLNLDIDGETARGQLKPTTRPIPAKYVGLQLNILPTEASVAVKKVGDMSDEIALLSKQLRQSNVINDLDTTIQQVRVTADRASLTLESLNKTVGDPKTVEDFRTAMANIRTTTDNASQVASRMVALAEKLTKNSDDISVTLNVTRTHLDELSKAVGDRFVQISKVLTNVEEITAKIDKGDGTAGQLLNDPRLYKELVDSSRELSETVKDMHRLIEQWEKEGITLKAKL